jgi:UDP-2-acetamido-3-amino-2,3-dideoxy-glucuronate N-acetyltransferase
MENFFVHETSIVDEGCKIGKNTKIWHFSHIMSMCTIGDGCNIGQNVVVSSGVILGKNNKVQNNVSIYTGVICDDDVFLGPSMVFTNVINPRSAIDRRDQYVKTHVGRGASIGANATIICGNDIGEYAFIGAGAVVTKSIPSFALVVGNPAKQIGWVGEYGHRLEFNVKGMATCSESKQEYRIMGNNLIKIKD